MLADAEVGGVGEFGAAAERPAVDRGDHRQRQRGDAHEQGGVDVRRARRPGGARAARRCRRRRRRRRWSPRGSAPGERCSSSAQTACSSSTICLVDRVARLGPVQPDVQPVGGIRVDEQGRVLPPSDGLDREGRALADADAHAGEAVAGALALHAAEQGDEDAGARCAERMPEGDRAAVGVDDLLAQVRAGASRRGPGWRRPR